MPESFFDPPDYLPQIKDGILSPDLYGAHAAGVWLTHATATLRALAVVPQILTVPAHAFILIEHLRNRLATDELIVADAADEIASARDSAELVKCGGLTAPSFHEIAVRYARCVLETIYTTADEREALFCTVDHLRTFPMEEIRARWDAVRIALADLELIGAMPDETLCDALRLEIIRTNERRPQPAAVPTPPVVDPAPPVPAPSGTDRPTLTPEEREQSIAKYLRENPNAPIKDVAAAVGAATGSVQKTEAWQAEMTRRKANRQPRVPLTRQLRNEGESSLLADERTPLDSIIDEEEASESAWRRILESANPRQRGVLNGMDKRQRGELIEYAQQQGEERTKMTIELIAEQADDATDANGRS